MDFKVTDKINAKDKEIIFQGLLEYNLARLEDKNPQDLGVYLRDDNDELLAGVIGNTHGNWLTVKYLWVSEALRGKPKSEAHKEALRKPKPKYRWLLPDGSERIMSASNGSRHKDWIRVEKIE